MTTNRTSPPPFWSAAFHQSWLSDADLRVSDAERSAMADQLSEHFGAGRLTEAEFQERVDQAMGAKTRRDLDGLLHDLPPLGQAVVPHRRRRYHRLLVLALVVLIAAAVGSWLATPHIPWVLVGIAALLIWRRSVRHRHACRTANLPYGYPGAGR